jgi:thiol-disulfide isomerase/thioredoxin
MKNILVFIIAVFFLSSCIRTTTYFDEAYRDVFKNAKKENKMVFIDFYTTWCGPCKLFENEIANNSIFKNFVLSNFITTKINAEIEENKTIVKKYGLTGYPTFIIANSNGDEIDRIVGLKANNVNEFISALEKIISGKGKLNNLEQDFYQNPDSLELFKTIILDKLLTRNLFIKTIELTDFAIENSNNKELKTEAQLYRAYSMIRQKKQPSPNPMIDFIKNEGISNEFKEYGLGELYFYHRRNNNMDSINYYLNALIKGNFNDHLGYVRDYAEFLYKQNKNIERADSLANEYSDYKENYADHWTPYLKAHSLMRHGKSEDGIEIFDKWMTSYSKPESFMNDLWHYYFYLEFICFYNLPSDNAVKYAEMIENYKSSAHNKKRLAQVYFINGMRQKAIRKLKEVKEQYENPSQKDEIEKLISEYSHN